MSSGSWYVETLDSVLEQYAPSEDLLNMLLRVSVKVQARGTWITVISLIPLGKSPAGSLVLRDVHSAHLHVAWNDFCN